MEAPAECFKSLNLARARPEQGQSINLSEEAVHAIAVEKSLWQDTTILPEQLPEVQKLS